MKKKSTWISLAIMAILVLAGIVWAVSFREDPNIAKVRELNTKLFNPDSQLSSEDRSKLWQQAREASENLTDDQRREVRREGFNAMRQRMEERIDKYLAITDEGERLAFLDEEIQRWEDRRQDWQRRRQEREANGEGRQREGNREGRGDQARGGGQRGGWGPGGRGGGDNESRMERRRGMLDATSPQQRAKFTEYMTAMRERREQLGLPEWGGRPGGRGGR